MQNEDDDKLNTLLTGRGSIAERTKIAKELDDDRLQTAAPYSKQAKEELERRRHERLLEATKRSMPGVRTPEPRSAERANAEVSYVNTDRIDELRRIADPKFDLDKVIRLCEELNICYTQECYFAVAMLTRAIVDHIPPIFALSIFSEVANNYGGRSFKKSMQHLDNSLRAIADTHLHTQVRKRETLPNRTQVNFANDLDVLLSEVVRRLK